LSSRAVLKEECRSVGRIVIRRLGRKDGGLRLRFQSALRASAAYTRHK
jgi:hypothetical protein